MGVGADGWPGIPDRLRDHILAADVVLGGARHLDLLPPLDGQVRERWPSPLRAELPALVQRYVGRRVVVLASGDPFMSGIATTLVELFGSESVDVEPAVSSVSLARARMAWAAETVETVSLVGRPATGVLRSLAPGHRLIVLSADERTPAEVAGLLSESGYAASRLTVLGDLAADSESRVEGLAGSWDAVSPRLNVIAVELVGPALPTWGLPDDAYESDGQLTRRDLRVAALSRLAPGPGQLLWDVGAGTGTVGIEWMRTHPTCRAVAVEARSDRAERITRNAARLGVPGLEVVVGSAPDALAGLPAPDAVFVGGGATSPGLVDRCLAALRPGGRLVVHGVTLETESLLAAARAKRGGELTRIQVEYAAPLGSFTGWTPARAVTQWAFDKETS
ncbi:MAG TPA: precorrin-6y C5,15-methyltransferase (decarboxylating) subunit CbiE [Nocardioides sp.]